MKNIVKLFGRWLTAVAGLATGAILVYAASTLINSVTTQTINKGDTIGSGWFQEVNDKVDEISNNISGDYFINLKDPVNNTDAATKAYVDSTVASAGSDPCTSFQLPSSADCAATCSDLGGSKKGEKSVSFLYGHRSQKGIRDSDNYYGCAAYSYCQSSRSSTSTTRTLCVCCFN